MASINVTSMAGCWDHISLLDFDLLAMQEVRIVDVPLWQRMATKEGMTLTMLPLARGTEHLVGFLHRRGSLQTMALATPLPSNRVHMATWHCDEGPPIVLGNFYGFAAPSTGQQAALSEAVQTFLDHCEGQQAPLALLVGDFNLERHQVPSCMWLEACGWSDVAAAGTCLASTPPRRIDWMMASRALQHRMVGIHLDWTTGMATHALQAIDVTLGTPAQYLQWAPPEAYPEPADITANHLEEASRRACATVDSDWLKAKASGDVDHMWLVIERAAHSLHTGLSGSPCQQGQTRKRARAVHKDEYGPGKHCEGMPVALPMRQAARAAKHLANLVGLLGKGHTDAHPAVAQLRAALAKDIELCPLLAKELRVVERTASLPELESSLRLVQAAVCDAKTALRELKRDQWHQWLSANKNRGSGAIYRWVKEGPRPPITLSARTGPDGTWLHGRGQAVAACDEAWWAIWGKEQATAPPNTSWLEHLRALPSYPARARLGSEQLRKMLSTSNVNKAAGPDGWRVAELKLWRGPLLDWVADLLAVVETGGRWPEALRRGETVLLPKGGTNDPLDRRPITLLAILYRVWAGIRATELRLWLKGSGVPLLVEGVDGTMLGAEHQGLLLALELEEASSMEEALAGVAVDWSKCYDHLGFGYVRATLQAAGVPAWVLEPLLNMYTAPRHLKVDGAMGAVHVPTRCIPPGCPAAVDVLALIMMPWVVQARRTLDGCHARGWVDDLTWWSKGPPGALIQAVEEVEGLIGTLRDSYDLVTNRVKSCVLGNSADLVQALQQRTLGMGLPVERTFKDLGVAQGHAKEGRAIVQKRWSAAVQRMRRIGALAMDLAGRGKFLGSSAMAAGTYGTGVAPTDACTAAWLRRWAMMAAWKGGRLALPGLLFSAQYLHWRADPVGHLAVRTWFFVWELLATRTREHGDLQQSWHQLQVKNWGPMAAAQQALSLCGLSGGLSRWTLTDERGHHVHLEQPMRHPIQLWRGWLLRGLALKSQHAAADRRPHVGLRGVTIEWAALPRAIRKLKMGPAAATALRGVTIGDVVTQRQAKHWNPGDTGLCPFCSGEEEDETHRWFVCPAWRVARAAVGIPTPALGLLQQLPQAMAIWGLPVLPYSVVEWTSTRGVHEMRLPPRPTIEMADVVCVDGSGQFPKDTWAVA